MILLMVSFQIISPHVKEIFSNHDVSDNKKFTVVVDAGHGGFDSGKVGIDGTLEKDVNLMIAKKLEKLLTAADITVIMTRTDDLGLYEESSDNKKRQDMFNRAAKMNESSADCVVSIRSAQNIVVIKTLAGNGNNAGTVIDKLNYSEVIGSVAGDDTVFAVCEDTQKAEAVVEKINQFLKK